MSTEVWVENIASILRAEEWTKQIVNKKHVLSKTCILLATCLAVLDPEDGGHTLLRNVDKLISDYTTLNYRNKVIFLVMSMKTSNSIINLSLYRLWRSLGL
jgi:hypothetical protein